MTVETMVSAPLGVAGEYPSHLAKLAKGGFHIVKDDAERNKLWDTLKDESLRVYVIDTKTFYLWDTDADDWTEDELVEVTPAAAKKSDALHGGETVLSGNTIAPPDQHRHRETSVGCLAYFDSEVIPAGGSGYVWPMNWVYNDTFINLDMRNKEIQINTMPNAPEDAHFLIVLSVQFKGTAGEALAYTVNLIDSEAGVALEDIDGNVFQKNINAVDGQPYEPVLLAGVVRVHDLKKIKIQVVNRFSTDLDIGDRVEKVSGLLIQELASGHAGGLPLLTAQQDMQKRFVTSHRYMGKGFAGMNYQMIEHKDLTVLNAGFGGYDSDDWALFVSKKGVQASSSRAGGLRIKSYDDPDHKQELSLWCVCKRIAGEELELLKQSGATVTVTVDSNQPTFTFQLRAIKFVGDIADVTGCPISDYHNDNVVYDSGYSNITSGSFTHPIDGVTPEAQKMQFTIPLDADAVVVCVGQPNTLSEPFDITFKDITFDASPAGIKWEVQVKDM
ncbi:hypothetical protein [Vibrio phage CKB-S2]|nr:hypothetical protein [Vibrio phage CKB-S2]